MKKLRNAAAVAAIVAMGATQSQATPVIVIEGLIIVSGLANLGLGFINDHNAANALQNTLEQAVSNCASQVSLGSTCTFYAEVCTNQPHQQIRADSLDKVREISRVSNGGGTTVITDEYEVKFTIINKCMDYYPAMGGPGDAGLIPQYVWAAGHSVTATGTYVRREYGPPPNFNFNFGNSGSTCSYCTGDDTDG